MIKPIKEYGFVAITKEEFIKNFKEYAPQISFDYTLNKEHYKNNLKPDFEDIGFTEEYDFILGFIPYEYMGDVTKANVTFEHYFYDKEYLYRIGFSGYDLCKMLHNEGSNISNKFIRGRDDVFCIKTEKDAKDITSFLNKKYMGVYNRMPDMFSENPKKVDEYKDYFEFVQDFNKKCCEEYISKLEKTFNLNIIGKEKYITFGENEFTDISRLNISDDTARFVVMMLQEAYEMGYRDKELDDEDFRD